MELIKNIFFNTDRIVKGETVKISYVGYLFQKGSEKVYLHYGFGENWDYVNDVEMEKTELGFQCEIKIVGNGTLNLCYKNENDEWDNNFGQNFIFTIETQEEGADDKDDEKIDSVDETNPENTALVVTSENKMQMHKGLRKSYIWGKKIKLAIYKIIKYVPKIVSGNYKRKINDEN